MPAKLEPRWITIEYSNPKCAPLEETSSGREFVIPESGYLCTSSAMYMGWHREKFYAVDERNSRTPIEVDKRILRPESFNVNEPSLDAGMPACKVTAEEFFFGSRDKLTHENPIMQDEDFLSHYHPECRHKGTTIRPSP